MIWWFSTDLFFYRYHVYNNMIGSVFHPQVILPVRGSTWLHVAIRRRPSHFAGHLRWGWHPLGATFGGQSLQATALGRQVRKGTAALNSNSTCLVYDGKKRWFTSGFFGWLLCQLVICGGFRSGKWMYVMMFSCTVVSLPSGITQKLAHRRPFLNNLDPLRSDLFRWVLLFFCAYLKSSLNLKKLTLW